jgi:hypothetical protein
MRLDHVSYAVPAAHLADEVQRIGAAIGGTFRDGGRHPRFGTRNFVCPLAGGTYIEVVSALDHPAADRFAFGQAVKQRAEEGGGWMAWVVSVDDIATVEQRLGRPAIQGNRHRPDGFDLTWKQLGLADTADDPQLPFFVEWQVDASEHPSADAAAGDVPRIAALEIAGAHERLDAWLEGGAAAALGGVDVEWIDGDGGLVAVHVQTRNGVVRLD